MPLLVKRFHGHGKYGAGRCIDISADYLVGDPRFDQVAEL
jgi:hypothetical protein